MDKFNFSGHCSRVVAVIGAHCAVCLLARSKRSARRASRKQKWEERGEGSRYVDKSIQPEEGGLKGQGIINWLLCVAVIGEAKLRTTIHPFPEAGRLSSRLALASILSPRLLSDRFQFLPSPSPPVLLPPLFSSWKNVANGPENFS